MQKIIVTGGKGRFASVLSKIKSKKYKFIFKDKKSLDITNISSIKKNLNKIKPKFILHLAGLSRPLNQHKTNISKSINLNIIGTANLVAECSKQNIKLIYFSSSYVYQGTRGNYKENDPVLPWSNYAWSKLGGECSVQMYHNSLILRVSMTEKPFIHKKAYANVKTNFIYHDDLANIMIKLMDKKGVINIGGPRQTIYNFAKKDNKVLKKIYSKGEFPLNQDMSLNKMKKILKK
jgi:dTDP-4-dehydrorhamnose reductase